MEYPNELLAGKGTLSHGCPAEFFWRRGWVSQEIMVLNLEWMVAGCSGNKGRYGGVVWGREFQTFKTREAHVACAARMWDVKRVRGCQLPLGKGW